MRPLVIVGTCKELHKCARLLDRYGYIPVNCRIPTCDNHDGGFIVLNREGEFRFSTCNLYANLDCMVTASDFLKNYGGLGIRSPYNLKNIYFACTLGLLVMGLEGSVPVGRLWLLAFFAVNLPLHFKTIKTWFNGKERRFGKRRAKADEN